MQEELKLTLLKKNLKELQDCKVHTHKTLIADYKNKIKSFEAELPQEGGEKIWYQ